MSSCGENYNINAAGTTCVMKSTAQLLTNNLMDRKYIPIPFTILLIFFSLSVIASKIHRYETFIPGCLVSFCGLFEWGSWITILILCSMNIGLLNIQGLPIVVGFLCNIILNIVNLIIYKKKMHSDPEFQNWL